MSIPSRHAHSESELVAGRYVVGHTIGRGGMGKVVHAQHIDLKQEVAIKYLRTASRSGSESAAKRFCQEALTYASINHPNIVKLLDFERTSHGELRMVLEYVKGETLGSFLRRHGQCHPMFAIDITTQIAQGLSAAHARSIIHRDLKPDNIMLCPVTKARRSYHVKLLDFGIAKNLHYEGERHTAAGTVCGTPDYMSPEQARGMDIDVRSDVYSLGVLFFEMLAGRLPYIATGKHEVMSAHCFTQIPMISDFSEYPIPVSLEDVIQRCLAKNPADRYQTVEDLIDALDYVAEREYDQISPVKYNALTPEGEQVRYRQHPARDLDQQEFQNSYELDLINEEVIARSQNALAFNPNQKHDAPHVPLSVLINSELSSAEEAGPDQDKVKIPPRHGNHVAHHGSIDDFRVEGVRMMSIGKWFQSILSEFKSHLNQEGSVSLTSGISFIVLVLVMISIFLKPQSPVPGHSTQFVSTLQEQIEVEVPDQRRAEVGPSSIARGGISSSTQVTTPSPKPYDQNAAARLAEQERAERRREFVHRAENLYDQGRLDDALEQVALLGSEESAIQLKRRIQLLRAFLERAETITCVRYLNEVKSVHVDIAQHPLVTTQTQRCQKSTPPRSLR